MSLYAAVSVGAAGAVTLMRWVYPTLGTGPNARTYQPAATGTFLPSLSGGQIVTPPGAGYPLQYAQGAEGVRSVVRTGAGAWLLQLQDNYQRVVSVPFTEQSANGAASVVVLSLSAITNMSANGGSVLALQFSSSSGVAADPASGSLILLKIVLNDATEP